ncbi:MAG: Mth938-like domain-containing protein [Candidatus Bathyarchaeia archaeon]
MRIEFYEFGKIVIDGKAYYRDILITPNGIKENWWRRSSHELRADDLKEFLERGIEVAIVGTGRYGFMRVLPDALQLLREVSSELIIQRTPEACRAYNEFAGAKRTFAALHLTC